MAPLRRRNGSWRLSFPYGPKQHTFTIGKVSEQEANQWKARSEQLLMRLKQGLLTVPPGCTPADFPANDGKPPVDSVLIATRSTTFGDLRERIIRV